MLIFVLFRLHKALELASAYAEGKMTTDFEKMVPRLPEIDDTHFPLKISQVSVVVGLIRIIIFFYSFIDRHLTAISPDAK